MLNLKKYKILPLGATTVIKNKNKKYKDINILYVGILSGRDIVKTIKAVNKFSEKYLGNIKITYKIIGYFNEGDKEKKLFLEEVSKSTNIYYLGRLRHDELNIYFEEATIGMSFIPISDRYMHQPPTKTFEYLSNGLITIATNTLENKKVICEENGVICNDNIEDIVRALENIIQNLSKFNSKEIIKTVNGNNWEEIVKNFKEEVLK